MSHSLPSLSIGTIIWDVKGDTKSLDYGSYGFRSSSLGLRIEVFEGSHTAKVSKSLARKHSDPFRLQECVLHIPACFLL